MGVGRYDGFAEDLENQAMQMFPDLITRADHVARMDDRLSALDIEGGMRSARRLGAVEMAIAKARAAVIGKDANASQLLEAVQKEVDAANEQMARVEQIKKFKLLPTEWEPGGDELTPTMKLKRKPISEKYGDEIEALYAK